MGELELDLGSMTHSISELDALVDASLRDVRKVDDRLSSSTSGWVGSSKRALGMARERLVTEGRSITSSVAEHLDGFEYAVRGYVDQESSNEAMLTFIPTDGDSTELNLCPSR